MELSYLILAHKNPTQLSRLVKKISGNDVYIFIHIDKKEDHKPFFNILSKYQNVFFCTNRISVNWGGFSMIEAILELIHLMLNTIKTTTDYVHLISGQDFPIKHHQCLIDFLNIHKGKNFIEHVALPKPDWHLGGMERIEFHWHIDSIGIEASRKAISDQLIREFIPNTTPYGGSQWWSLTGECVRWLATQCVEGNKIYNFYKSTIYPDEMLIQTLLMASPFKETLINSNLHKIDWIIPGSYPHIWLQNDLEVLKKTSKFFARKFDESVDYSILSSIESHISIPSTNISLAISLIIYTLEESNRLLVRVQNILNQTFSNFELIIITKNTNIKSLSNLQDPRITLIESSHNLTINKLSNLIKGEFVVRVNMDKIILPEYLETLYEFMISNSDIDVCGEWLEGDLPSNIIIFPTNHNSIILQMLNENMIYNSFSIIKKKSLPYQSIPKIINSDTGNYDLWINLYRCGVQFAIVPSVLSKLEIKHNNQKKSFNSIPVNKLINSIVEKIKKEQEYFAPYIQTSMKLYEEKIISINTIIAIFKSIPKL